jgi:small subunit ribosomal protein S20
MPHTRSARKNLRKADKRRAHNRAVIKTIKTHVKRVTAAAEGSVEQLQKEYVEAAKKLDKAAAKGIIHKNQAARKKSQLARLLNAKKKAGAAPAAPKA